MAETGPEKRHQYHGDLGETALPEMLYTIFLHRVQGIIEASRQNVVKKIYVRDGAVIHASSTDPEDRLGVFLLRSGKIDQAQFDLSMKTRGEGDKRHGEVLIEQDILTPAELYIAIQEQIRAVVWSLFSWTQGQVTFEIGEFEEADMIRIHLPMRQVILQGVKRAPDAKALVARLGRKETVFEPTWSTEALIEIAVDDEELKLLRLLDGKRTLYELCTTGPFSPAENARMLYTYYVLRLMRRQAGERGSGVIKIRLKGSR